MMSKSRQIGFEGGMRVSTTKKAMHKELPISKKWSKSIKSLTTNKDFDKKKTEYYYSCTFKMPTNPDQLKEYLDNAEFAATLPFAERLNYEMSRVNVSAYVKNVNFFIGDGVPNTKLPEKVTSIFTEMVKVKMLVEFEVYGNEEIKATIPDLDESKIDMNIINNEIKNLKEQLHPEEEMDIDSILDKINVYGITSITERELEFLNQQSKKF